MTPTTDTIPTVRYSLFLFTYQNVWGQYVGGFPFRHQALAAARAAVAVAGEGVVKIVKDRKVWGHVRRRKDKKTFITRWPC